MTEESTAPEATRRPAIRLAHLLDGRHFGGAEQFVRRLIETAPAIGVEARAWCLNEGRLAEFLRAQGLRVRVFGGFSKYDPRIIQPILRAVREEDIQLLQAHTSRTHLLARIVSRRLGIPNLTTIHSPIAQDENRSTMRHPLRALVERLGRPWTNHIVCVSREETERLLAEEAVAPDKITWIPTGAYPPGPAAREAGRAALAGFLAERGRPEGGLKIVMIAQMRPRKGAEVLIQAFAQWTRVGGGRGDLVLIGDDEFTGAGYLDSLKDLARARGVGAAAHFTGFMAAPWTLAAGADILALPSLFGEGMPLTLLEAMSHGIPIAVSDTAGNRELARGGKHGWIHPPGGVGALASQLGDAAVKPEVREARGAAARRWFLDHYTLEAVQERYRELYEALIKNAECGMRNAE